MLPAGCGEWAMKRATAAALAALQIAYLPQGAGAQSGRDSDFVDAIASMQHSVAPVMCVRAVQPQLQPLPQQQIPSPPQVGGAPSNSTSSQFQPVVAGTAFFLTRRGDFVTAASVLGNFLAPGQFAG